MTNVLINGLPLNSGFTGVQYYTENLLQAMRSVSSKSININFLISTGYKGDAKVTKDITLVQSGIDSRSRLKRIFFENFLLGKILKRSDCVLYHAPTYLLPWLSSFPSVLTIHDLIAIDYPEYSKNETVLYHFLLQKRSINRATRIIAVSETVKKDIIRNYNIDENKISVVYHGVKDIFKKVLCQERLAKVREKYFLPSRYILFVGNIEPKKNLSRLFEAYDMLRRNFNIEHKLVIVGKTGWKYHSTLKVIDDLGLKKDVLFLGYVDECELPSIYTMADLFVFPSLYEGFGIPPLEAMACETPVLVSNSGALPEVTGGVCLQANPWDVADIARQMMALLTTESLRTQTVMNGKQWVQQFSWKQAADKTLSIYEEVLRTLKPVQIV